MGSNRILLLTALPLEAAAVRARLPELARRDLPTGTIVEEAVMPGTGYTVCLVCTGSGNGQAALVAQRVISWANPAAVFFVGVAGTLKRDIPLGDVVVATRIMGYERGKDTVAGFKPEPETWGGAHRLLQVAQYVEANGSWLRFLPDTGAQLAPAVHFKPIASGDTVKDTDESPLSTLLSTTYYAASAIEMEAAGVARAAQDAHVDLLVIRGISDPADGTKASSDARGWQPQAAAHAAAFALGVITALPAPEPVSGYATGEGAKESPAPIVDPGWSVLSQPPAVTWRTGLYQAYSTESAILELHLVPVDSSTRLQVVQLRTLSSELVQLGRTRGLFGQAEAVEGQPTSDSAVAFTRGARGTGTTGLAILRSGQRSAWEALPKIDQLSVALFNPDYIAKRIAMLLDVLLAVPAPMPDRTVPVAGIEPAMLITRGAVGVPHHGGATFRMNGQPIRTEATESVNANGLPHVTTQVAEELAARLDQAFDNRH